MGLICTIYYADLPLLMLGTTFWAFVVL